MSGYEIVTIDTPSLGDRSYLATDGRVVVVVDPQRDIDRVLEIVESRGLTVTHVLETHIHNDYVTGGYELARRTGAHYCLNAEDLVSFERTPVRDGDVLEAGALAIRVLATPGHTFTHLSYALSHEGEPVAVFTGGSLLHGATGRTDLLGDTHADTLSRHQHSSAARLADELPHELPILPTHGFGSFCSSGSSEADASTIGDEVRTNPVLTNDVDTYVRELIAGLDDCPAYYAHMMPANASGPGPVDLGEPQVADPADLRRRLEAGEWLVDLRSRRAFSAGYVHGTLNFGLDGSFVTYLGWLIPWGTPVTLLAATAEDVAEAQRDLARIGIDRPAAMATGEPHTWIADGRLAAIRRVTFADLADEPDRPYVLDVRRTDEYRAGHLEDAHHLPIHRVLEHRHAVPSDRPVWVHCASGYRAAIAASVLARAGVDVVLVDDDYDHAEKAGLPVVSGT